MNTNTNNVPVWIDMVQQVYGPAEIFAADEAGLDCRAGNIAVGDYYVATENPSALEYYGGFCYVSSAARCLLPNGTVVYLAHADESDRVNDVLDAAYGM